MQTFLFVGFGNGAPQPLALDDEWSAGTSTLAGSTSIVWDSLKRRGSGAARAERPGLFYPIFVSEDGRRIVKIGDSIPADAERTSVAPVPGCVTVWPLRSNGEEGRWQISQDQLPM